MKKKFNDHNEHGDYNQEWLEVKHKQYQMKMLLQ